MNRKGEKVRRICDGDQGDWFPDGQRILFRRQGQIMARSLDTGQESVLSPTGWSSCSAPACSPDGRRILFVSRNGDKDVICLLSLEKSEPRRLIEGEILGAPRWAPDGGRLAFQGGAHLWLIDADGSNKRQLTTAGGVQTRPAWSPDGSALAFCQGPGPRGPWQLAVIRADGTRTVSIPFGDARSVLCSDWGVDSPGPKVEPQRGLSLPPPRVRFWSIDQLAPAAPEDWATFCRERKGWSSLPLEKVQSRELRGGCAIENDCAVLALLPGRRSAVLIPKSSLPGAIAFTLLDSLGKEAGPVGSVRVRTCGPDEAVLESVSHSVKATWTIGGSRALVQVAPLENATKLRITIPLPCVVVPDRFGNDLIVDPEALSEKRAQLPWAPLVVGLLGTGSEMLVLSCPVPGQSALVRKGEGLSFVGIDVAMQNRAVAAGVTGCPRAWHRERFGTKGTADPIRFTWRMPCAATWRLAVQGGRQRSSALFTDKESARFDKKDVLFTKGSDFTDAVRLGLIYLYGRTAGTPPETLTPVDLLRDALGLKAAQHALDDDGLIDYRRAAGPTTWAEPAVTIESLRFLFERQVEVQDAVYVRHLCDDLLPFVEGMDQRLNEYADFARTIETLCQTSNRPSPAAAKILDELTTAVQKLRQLGARQRGLRSSKELPSLCTQIKKLTDAESSENRKQCERCSRELLQIIAPREEMLRAYRKLAVAVRDTAGSAPLAHAELLGLAEKTRALCQGVLRNRFYVEADWRGEDYQVPAFWLGRRPFQ
jgi:hypothetical protein